MNNLNISTNEYDTISYDIKDSSDMDSINFKNTFGVKFIKTFYITSKKTKKTNESHQKLVIINVKLINNCIYAYRIDNGKRHLIKVVTVGKCSNHKLLFNLVKLNSDWTTLSIPTSSHIYLIDLSQIFKGIFHEKRIRFDVNKLSDMNYLLSVYPDNITIIKFSYTGTLLLKLYEKNKKIIDINDKMNIKIGSINFDNTSISDNGAYVLIHDSNCIKILDVLTEQIVRMDLTIKTSNIYSKKWLISDDGRVLINKNKVSLVAIVNTGESWELNDLTYYIPKYSMIYSHLSIMLREINLYKKIITHSIIIRNNVTRKHNLMGIIIDGASVSSSVTNSLDLKDLTFPVDGYKLSTNGKIQIYRNRITGDTKINDIHLSMYIPIIRSICDNILKQIDVSIFPADRKDDIIICNPTSAKKSKLTNTLKKIFFSVTTSNTFVIRAQNLLTTPILDNYKGDTLDILDIIVSILGDLDNVNKLLCIIKNDELFMSKSRLVIDMLKEVYETIIDKPINTPEYYKIKEYIELSILYFIIIYKTTSHNINIEKDECRNIIKDFCEMGIVSVNTNFI